MSIRELSLSEIDMVSGAGKNWCLEETYNNFTAGMSSFKNQANALGREGDWHIVAANDPCLSREIEAFLNDYGFGGKASLENWKKIYG